MSLEKLLAHHGFDQETILVIKYYELKIETNFKMKHITSQQGSTDTLFGQDLGGMIASSPSAGATPPARVRPSVLVP